MKKIFLNIANMRIGPNPNPQSHANINIYVKKYFITFLFIFFKKYLINNINYTNYYHFSIYDLANIYFLQIKA